MAQIRIPRPNCAAADSCTFGGGRNSWLDRLSFRNGEAAIPARVRASGETVWPEAI